MCRNLALWPQRLFLSSPFSKNFSPIEFFQTFTHSPRRPPQTSWTVSPHISSCKCQRPHTSGSVFPNIKANNDDVLVYGSLRGELGKMAISFIMSRVCCCCRTIVKIVSASGGCIKKKTKKNTQRSGLSAGLIYFQSRVKCQKRQP